MSYNTTDAAPQGRTYMVLGGNLSWPNSSHKSMAKLLHHCLRCLLITIKQGNQLLEGQRQQAALTFWVMVPPQVHNLLSMHGLVLSLSLLTMPKLCVLCPLTCSSVMAGAPFSSPSNMECAVVITSARWPGAGTTLRKWSTTKPRASTCVDRDMGCS